MTLTVRQFEPSRDYEDVCEWWKAHDWDAQPLEALSTLGFIAEKGGQKIAAVWLYISNSAISYLEFMVTNPKAPLRARRDGIREVGIAGLMSAKACGAKLVFSSLKSRGLIREYERLGFSKGDPGMTNLIARV